MEYMEPLVFLKKIYALYNVFALHDYIYSFYFQIYIHRKLNHKALKKKSHKAQNRFLHIFI